MIIDNKVFIAEMYEMKYVLLVYEKPIGYSDEVDKLNLVKTEVENNYGVIISMKRGYESNGYICNILKVGDESYNYNMDSACSYIVEDYKYNIKRNIFIKLFNSIQKLLGIEVDYSKYDSTIEYFLTIENEENGTYKMYVKYKRHRKNGEVVKLSTLVKVGTMEECVECKLRIQSIIDKELRKQHEIKI